MARNGKRMHNAFSKGDTLKVASILQSYSNLNVNYLSSSFGWTPLQIACSQGHVDIATLLLSHPAMEETKGNLLVFLLID